MPAPKNNVQEGKPRPSLIPMDVLMKHVAPAYEEGVLKYERDSWRDGFNTTVLYDAAERHMSKFFHEGEDMDPDARDLGIAKHHLAGAVFSLLSILHTLEHHPELDDRPSKRRQKNENLEKPDLSESSFIGTHHGPNIGMDCD